ncbi:ABC transporter ATP-binding protein [Austwickia chelonae]|uniref:ABC transporter ATP-binding protein n=1 Tax=Austwickia chelonae TaxID=100225 RepID=UPI0013C375E0|nr:ABC transporter ATP-binding protein [Austwickia chelonae]
MPKVPLRDLLALVRPEQRGLALAIALGFVSSGIALAQPLLVRRLVDGFTASNSQDSTRVATLLLVAAMLVEALLGAWQSWVLGRAGENFVSGLRTRMVQRIFRLPMSGYARYRTGDLLSRVAADTSAVRSALSTSLVELSSGTILLIGALVVMMSLTPLLTLVTVVCVAGAGLVVGVLSIHVMAASYGAQRTLGQLNAGLERALRNPRTVKLNQAEDFEETIATSAIDEVRRRGYAMARLEALLQPVTSIAVQGAMVAVITLGGLRVADGRMTLGTLTAFVLYLLYIAVPITSVFMAVTDIQAGRASLHRSMEILSEEVEPIGGRTCVGPATVEFDEVSFSYPDGRRVLDEVHFQCAERGVTAVVGPSGGGKSTVLALVAGLYTATGGTVRVGGQDVRELSMKSLRSRIAYVEQESPVLAGTLRENLTYGLAEPPKDSTILRVMDLVELEDLTRSPGSLLDLAIGESGANLSGGQRQRVALARGLLRAPDILLLDEVTSQVDALNEESILRTVDELARSRSVVLVAHRLSTVRRADQVIVLEAGQVVDKGTHDELLSRCPLYQHMVSTQMLTG